MEQCLCIAFIHLLIYLLRGSLGFAVSQYWTMFFCGVSEILLSKCGIVIFSEPAGCIFLSNFDGIKYYPPSPPTFSKPVSVSDET